LFALLLAAAPRPVSPSDSPTQSPIAAVQNPAMPAPPPRLVPAPPPLTEADLAPFLATPEALAAKKLFDDGRYLAAHAALNKQPPTTTTRYLDGLCLLHLDRNAEAGQLFSKLAADLPALAGRCHFHAAVAYEDANQLPAAQREYESVEAGSIVWGEAQLGLARVRRARHDLSGARAAVKPLADRASSSAGRDLQAEALVFLAELAHQSGNREAAKAADLKLWTDHPLARISDAALADAKRLGLKEPSNAQKLRRAEVLLDSNRNPAALALLQPLLPVWKLPEATACQVHFLYGKALRKQRRHTEALAALAPVITACTADPELRVRALYIAGSSGSIVAPEQGIVAYTALARSYPEHSYADDALFFAADIDQKAGKLDAARALLETLADSPAYRDGDYRAEGLFRLFWIARMQKQPERGLSVLDRIISEYGGLKPAEVERAEYWRARTLAALGQHPEADQGYAALIRAHPTSYYALLARSRLSECHLAKADALTSAVEQLPAPAPQAFDPGALRDAPHFQAALQLYRMGLGDAAADELVAIPRAPLRETESDALELLVELLARSGDARAAQAIARTELHRDLSGPPSAASMNLWLAAYPLAFRPELQKSCTAAKVEPDLFQALIREESALDPNVVSWAGAVGLSQLMPATARSLARQMHVKGSMTVERLQQPELNLELGSHYVGQLLRRFSGNPALALAAYNAGASAVGRWLRDSGDDELDAFVEEIPIAETRGYVKRVLQSYNVYQLLYARRAQARLPRATLPPLHLSRAPAPDSAVAASK